MTVHRGHDFDPGCRENILPDGSLRGECMATATTAAGDDTTNTPPVTVRLWDEDFNLIATWSDGKFVRDLVDGYHMSVDSPQGERDHYTIVDGKPVHDSELLKSYTVWANPFLPEIATEGRE